MKKTVAFNFICKIELRKKNFYNISVKTFWRTMIFAKCKLQHTQIYNLHSKIIFLCQMLSKTLLPQSFENKQKLDFQRTFNQRTKLLNNFHQKRFWVSTRTKFTYHLNTIYTKKNVKKNFMPFVNFSFDI